MTEGQCSAEGREDETDRASGKLLVAAALGTDAGS